MDGTKDFEMGDDQKTVEIRSYEGALDLDEKDGILVGSYLRTDIQPEKLIWQGWE